jgi:hypothetical protein
VRRHRGASPSRMMVPPCRCQGIKCPCTGAGARARGALERGGPCSRAERSLERGGASSRGSGLSSEAESARGKRTPLNGTEPTRGRRASSSEAKPARGDLRVGRLGGPLGASAAWVVSCMVRRGVFSFVSCFKLGFPSCLRGPLGLSPTGAITKKWDLGALLTKVSQSV